MLQRREPQRQMPQVGKPAHGTGSATQWRVENTHSRSSSPCPPSPPLPQSKRP
ncbi:hypothetical protein [Tolypothrix sp. VBCCA 56010]|uniref:hypothetical protein n=1 Tax=Tolypothrix sp. VBCCA 56010 TaxID=3137731 RepID=UPI003D7EDC7B